MASIAESRQERVGQNRRNPITGSWAVTGYLPPVSWETRGQFAIDSSVHSARENETMDSACTMTTVSSVRRIEGSRSKRLTHVLMSSCLRRHIPYDGWLMVLVNH